MWGISAPTIVQVSLACTQIRHLPQYHQRTCFQQCKNQRVPNSTQQVCISILLGAAEAARNRLWQGNPTAQAASPHACFDEIARHTAEDGVFSLRQPWQPGGLFETHLLARACRIADNQTKNIGQHNPLPHSAHSPFFFQTSRKGVSHPSLLAIVKGTDWGPFWSLHFAGRPRGLIVKSIGSSARADF